MNQIWSINSRKAKGRRKAAENVSPASTTKSPTAVAGFDHSTRDRADPPELSGTRLTRSTVGHVTKTT
jgi:hypothetical protein